MNTMLQPTMFSRFGWSVLIFLSLCHIAGASQEGGKNNSEVEIDRTDAHVAQTWNELIQHYDRLVRPNYTGSATTIFVEITVLSFGQINERDMSFSVDLFLRQIWQDHRMKHDLPEPILPLFGQKSPADFIWVPDSTFINAQQSTQHRVTVGHNKLDIYNNGTVFWGSRISVVASCHLDLRRYPLDTQKCHIGIESYAYPNDEMDYEWNGGEMACIVNNDYMSQYTVTHRHLYEDVGCYMLGNFSILKAEFTFQRRAAFSIIQIFFPTISIVCVSWIPLWIHKRCTSARVGMGVTTLLTLCTIWGSVNYRLPVVSYIKAVDWYFMFSFCFVLLTLLEYAFVLNVGFAYHPKVKRKIRRRPHVQKTKREIKTSDTEDIPLQERVTISRLEPQSQTVSTTAVRKKKVSVTNSLYHQRELPQIFDADNKESVRSVTYNIQDNQRKLETMREKVQGEETAHLDKISRIVLPSGFLVFNLYFWIKFGLQDVH